MKKLFIAFAVFLGLTGAAQAQKTLATLISEINTNFADNTSNAITAALLRSTTTDMLNSIMPTAPVGAGNLACFSGTTGLLSDCGFLPNLTIGTSTITGGSTTNILYDNAGKVGEYTINGSGTVVCMATSCSMTTPTLGVALATSLNGNTFTVGTYTLTGVAGKTLTFNNSLTLAGTDSTTMTFPGSSDTVVGLVASQTLTNKTLTSPTLTTPFLGTPQSGVLTNATGCTISGCVSGLGTGVATALGNNTNSTGGFPTYTATTWTPTVTTTSTVGTPAYTTQVGSYEQIGRQITVRFTIVLSGWTGSPTGNVNIGGLPVTSANVANDNGSCHLQEYIVVGLAASNFGIEGNIQPNTTLIQLTQNANTSTGFITAAQAGTTPTFVGSCVYHN